MQVIIKPSRRKRAEKALQALRDAANSLPRGTPAKSVEAFFKAMLREAEAKMNSRRVA